MVVHVQLVRCAAVSLRMLPDSARSTACQTGDTDNLPSRDRCARYVTRACICYRVHHN